MTIESPVTSNLKFIGKEGKNLEDPYGLVIKRCTFSKIPYSSQTPAFLGLREVSSPLNRTVVTFSRLLPLSRLTFPLLRR